MQQGSAKMLSTEMQEDTSRTALIIAAHGSSRRGEAAEHVERIAAAIRAQNRFSEVATAYLIDGVDPAGLPLDDAEAVVIVPFMMADGYLSEKITNGLTSTLSQRSPGLRVYTAQPIGLRPEIADFVIERAQEILSGRQWRAEDSRLVLVAHGSSVRPESRRITESQTEAIRTGGRFKSVALALLEEAPRVDDVLAEDMGQSVVVGLFAAPGGHALDDVSEAIRASGRHNIANAGPVGLAPDISGLVVRCALSALNS